MVEVNQRDQRFAALVSLEAVPELAALRASTQHELVIGAGLQLSS